MLAYADHSPDSEPGPSVELALILELARSDGSRILELCDRTRFDVLADSLGRLLLLGLLGQRLIDRESDRVPDFFRARVERIIEAGREEALYKQMLTWRLFRELERAGIRALPLKGPFMCERLHGDAALRLSNDIDLLVSPTDMRRAVAVIEEQGWVRPRVSDELPRRLHHIFLADDAPPVELHWRISWYERTYSQGLLDRAIHDGTVLRPSPADELISLLVFHARDGLVGLRYPVDVAAWWKLHDGSVQELTTAKHLVSQHPALERPFAAGALSVERLLGIPIASVLGLRITHGTRAAVRLRDWAELRPPPAADAAAKLVDGLVTAPRALPTWLRRVALPVLPGTGMRRVLDQAAWMLVLAKRSLPLYWQLLRSREITMDRVDLLEKGKRPRSNTT
jgi:Uncharacterised nucleotidyltransferase